MPHNGAGVDGLQRMAEGGGPLREVPDSLGSFFRLPA